MANENINPVNNPQSSVTEAYDWVESIVFALAIVIVIFTFIVRVIGVCGVSMENTLNAGVVNENDFRDRVVISDLGYKTPKRGDIVVIKSSAALNNELIIKRVIGVGGDTVNIDFNKHTVSVNGKVLDEPYIKEPTSERGDVSFPVKVPQGHVFVMGDNRNDSYDSRFSAVGMVDDKDIIGHALLRIYPLNEVKLLTGGK